MVGVVSFPGFERRKKESGLPKRIGRCARATAEGHGLQGICAVLFLLFEGMLLHI